LAYILFGASVCAIIGAAIWVMPRVTDYWELRWVVGMGLIVVLCLMIGGIASLCDLSREARGADLATRNVKDFEDCGVNVVNPWTP
jgi:hypothetical protein